MGRTGRRYAVSITSSRWRSPPPSRTPTGTVTVPRALLIVLSGMLLATLLAVAFLLGREAGRAETAAPDLLAAAPPAPVEPAPARRTAPQPRARPAPPPRPPRVEPEPAPPSGPTTPPPATQAPEPPAPAEPAAHSRERAAVARYFEGFDEIAGSNAGAGNPETIAMALLSQATGGDWRPVRRARCHPAGAAAAATRPSRPAGVPGIPPEDDHAPRRGRRPAGQGQAGGAVRQSGCPELPHDNRPAAADRRRGCQPAGCRHPAALRNLEGMGSRRGAQDRRERLHHKAKAVRSQA